MCPVPKAFNLDGGCILRVKLLMDVVQLKTSHMLDVVDNVEQRAEQLVVLLDMGKKVPEHLLKYV